MAVQSPREGFTLHDQHSAPDEARRFLDQAGEALGKVPNLERVMADSPPLLEAYVHTWALFDRTMLTPVERQVVYQTANLHNGCTYCVPWHTDLSRRAGMKPETIQALRDAASLPEPRLEALRRFTLAVLKHKGAVPDDELLLFRDAGYTEQQSLEVVLGLAIKLMSNYTNRLARTPLDEEMIQLAWEKPGD